MFSNTKAFSSFSVNDLEKAKQFYAETLGLVVGDEHGMLWLQIANNGKILIYPKENHTPAAHTILNFPVANLERSMNELKKLGVRFEHYDLPEIKTDENGVLQGEGPKIAWFKDPAGNILSVLEDKNLANQTK